MDIPEKENGSTDQGGKSPLSEDEQNFIGWCVRKIDDFIYEFVEETLQAPNNMLLATHAPDMEDDEQYEKYLDKLMGAVYAGLGPEVEVPEVFDMTCNHSEVCRSKGTYDLEMYCTTCSWEGTTRWTLGHKPEWSSRCPNCDNSTIGIKREPR